MAVTIFSVKMIQICGESIALPLKLIFETALKEKKFPDIWKIANVVPVHKKEEKNLLRNYRPISLLPIFSKIFERVIYNCLFNYFVTNKLFTPAQSGFLPGDSCIAQLLSIIHEIQTNFDTNPPADVRGVFLDISKAFDKVWHKGLIFKLKSYGVEGDLLSLLECYLTIKKSKGCFKWSDFRFETISFWHSPRFSIRSTFILNIYKRFARRHNVHV